MRKLLILFLVLMLGTICLFGCRDEEDADQPAADDTQSDRPSEDGSDTTPDASESENDETQTPGTNKVRFFINGQIVIQYYHIGEMPVPPEVSDFTDEHYLMRFVGWDKEIVAVSGNEDIDFYRAQYEYTPRDFTVTFDIYGAPEVVTVTYGEQIPYPQSVATPEGAVFAGWSTSKTICEGDMTIYPVYSFLYDEKTMRSIYSFSLIGYSVGLSDNRGMTFSEATAFLALAAEEHEHPMNGAVKNRVLQHLYEVSRGGIEPCFDAGPYWSYAILSAAIAVSKNTPTVWNSLTEDEVARLDCIMRTFAVLACFATDSDNNYLTGPSLKGNYCKGWNPNYRLANVPILLFCKSYFGSTEAVDRIFAEFDYDTYVAEFRSFGFVRALEVWTTETHRVLVGDDMPLYDANHKRDTSKDGMYLTVLGAKDLLTNGGVAYAYDIRYGGDLMYAGRGVGVKDNTYTYTYSHTVGDRKVAVYHTLDDVAGIVYALLDYTYSGGEVTDGWSDGVHTAYIDDGTSSIMLGQLGMIKEFNTGNRSSAGYSAHDFSLTVGILYALEVLDMYDIRDLAGLDESAAEQKAALWSRVCVGNEDLIYKLIHGYWSYAASGGKITLVTESDRDFGYRITKAIWCYYYYPSSYGYETMTAGDTDTSEDTEDDSLDAHA